jgi:RNA polymerase sigma-70 factor (ECF subfamily)
MYTTHGSLLEGLKQPDRQDCWNRFVELYTPLVYLWVRRAGLEPNDASDVVQEVLTTLVQKAPTFVYEPTKGFRNWLLTVTLNKCRDFFRRRNVRPRGATDELLSALADSAADESLAETEYRRYLVARALELMQAEFEPNTWKACWETVVAGRRAADVAKELGISENAVYLSKGRVLRRLREELKGLM